VSVFTLTSSTVDPADRTGLRPPGPAGTTLGPFSCLREARPETVADAVVGQNVGDSCPEPLARERLRWCRGISALDRATSGAVCLDFVDGSGLVRVVVVDGERRWRRVSLRANPRRDVNLPPQPVREVPIGNDTGVQRLKSAELADLHRALDERLRFHGLIP
jgi:hypothetical protein